MWYHYDRLGNVMELTDENGILSASYDQDAFGNVLEGSQSGYHLTTKEYSPPISLYYFYQRWYEPELGRFISLDPWRAPNRYKYCDNNPIIFYDPTGELSQPDPNACPKSEDEVKNNPNFCKDKGIMNYKNYDCYREVPDKKPGKEARHCCYQNGTIVPPPKEGKNGDKWGSHYDGHSPVEGRNCDGTCNYHQGWCIVHFLCDTIPSGWIGIY